MMYQKWIAALLSTAVIAAGVQVPYAVKAEPAVSVVSTTGLDQFSSLDLDTVLQRGLDKSYNLPLLTLKYMAQGHKKDDLNAQRDELGGASSATVHLPENAAEFSAVMPGMKPQEELWLGPLSGTNKVINQMVQGQAVMVGEVNAFISQQREQMRSAAHQLEADQQNTLLQTDEAKEGIRLQLTSQYVQLLAMRKQQELMNGYESVLQKDLVRAQRLHAEGLASDEEERTVAKQLRKHQDDMKMLQHQLQLGLVQLSFDLGIAYNPNLVLRDVPADGYGPVSKLNTSELVEASYPMKTAMNQVTEAAWQASNTVTQNTYGQAYLGDQTAISSLKLQQTRLELSRKVEATYTEAEQAFEACLTEERNVQDAKLDYARMKSRYEAGLISAHDLQKLQFKITQSETALTLAKLKYFAVSKKASAMEKGLII
ncbi:TolC family protein [Paenibacillus sp. GD4]|uniref:TolC family protein n=1 Tax=Paenibacillus sp. GD4 TaxID=3068890 RepID=UPI0027966DFB|nr:TolC family protein [Paenibacillus sp. GD4]MDQ1909896.1 TolC family protein [Paenibacillus sp. GD4]